MKEEKLYLRHIVEASGRIQSYVAPGKSEFLRNQMMQDAVIKVLANVTESIDNLHQATKAAHSDMPWKMVKALRNALVHEYLGDLELEELWKIIHDDLPGLVDAAKKILKEKYGTEL